MGINLKNPVIAGACELTSDLDSMKRMEDAGAAAVVAKSLFEEQIQLERYKFDEDQEKYNYRHAEMITVFPHMEYAGPAEHLKWLRETKEALDIPVIGSLNAVNHDSWIEYATQIEQTGVDALECNLFAVPKDPDISGDHVEQQQVDLVREIRQTVSIPLSVKLSYLYTNPLNTIQNMAKAGANAVVLFNRLFEPDLDIANNKHSYPFNFSHEDDYRLPLRYTGLLEGKIDADICATTGIFSGATIIKMIMAGAASVQTVSALYNLGIEHIQTMLQEVAKWMDENGKSSLSAIRGTMSRRHSRDYWAYTRAQYIKLLLNPEELIYNAPTA
jgi:dihydroorotate dehydrogenase (fumarate)